MIKRNVLIRSKQVFEEHTDSIEEIHECIMEKLEKEFRIIYDNTMIIIMENVVIIKRENARIEIEKDKNIVMPYSTPYGVITLETEGKYFQWEEEPFLFEIKYQIKIENNKEYLNELQVIVMDD